MKIPKTRKENVVNSINGVLVSDPYRWLEGDPNNNEIHEWLTEQTTESSKYFSSLPIRNILRDELKHLKESDFFGMPIPRNERYFYVRREANQDMSVLYVREGLEGEERVLVDQNILSADKTTVLSGWSPSRDGKWLVYGLSKSGNDKRDLYVMNVDTGEILFDHIPADVYPSISSWRPDGKGFYYLRRDPDAPAGELKFHRRFYFHKVGTDSKDDKYFWGNGLERECMPGMLISHDGKYQVVIIHGQEKGENWNEIYLKRTDSEVDFKLILKRVLGSEFGVHIHRDKLYVITNDGAPHWKLMATLVEKALAGIPEWTDFIPEGSDVIESFKFIGDKVFVVHAHNVQSVVNEYTLDGELVRNITLPSIGSVSNFSGESEGNEFFYSFTSFVYPLVIFRLDIQTGNVKVFAETKAKFDVSDIVTEQVWCTSKDGTRIPMFLVYRKDLQKNGSNPTLLYGYGGFDNSLTPSYATGPIPFIKRGGIYAVANLRGGGEFGREWHEAGMKKNKQNVFDDFIASVEYLILEGYTSKDKIAIMGASNGGLLVAATEIQRPDLVKAVVCRVPVTDMLRYHLHHGGRHWIPDFGDPDDVCMTNYLLSYSPYHNVKDGEKYPSTLIMTADGDDRVHPLHAYKFAARLQEANTSKNPIIVRVEMKAGHAGAHSISRFVEQEADLWSFVFDQLKV